MFTVGLDVDRVKDLCSQKIELCCWKLRRKLGPLVRSKPMIRDQAVKGEDYVRKNPKKEERSAGNFRLSSSP